MGRPAEPRSYLADAAFALTRALVGHAACCPDCGGHKEFTPCVAALRCLDWSVPLRPEDAALVREG